MTTIAIAIAIAIAITISILFIKSRDQFTAQVPTDLKVRYAQLRQNPLQMQIVTDFLSQLSKSNGKYYLNSQHLGCQLAAAADAPMPIASATTAVNQYDPTWIDPRTKDSNVVRYNTDDKVECASDDGTNCYWNNKSAGVVNAMVQTELGMVIQLSKTQDMASPMISPHVLPNQNGFHNISWIHSETSQLLTYYK